MRRTQACRLDPSAVLANQHLARRGMIAVSHEESMAVFGLLISLQTRIGYVHASAQSVNARQNCEFQVQKEGNAEPQRSNIEAKNMFKCALSAKLTA